MSVIIAVILGLITKKPSIKTTMALEPVRIPFCPMHDMPLASAGQKMG